MDKKGLVMAANNISYMFVILATVFGLSACNLDRDSSSDESSADDSNTTVSTENQREGSWIYRISDDNEAVVLWGDGSEKAESVVMIPAELGGYSVTALGNGEYNSLSNNKISNNFVLLPSSLTTVSSRAIYDYNDTAGWVFPGNITSISDTALASSQGGTYYIDEGSALEIYVMETEKNYAYLSQSDTREFSLCADENGYIQPNGNYYLPSAMLGGGYEKSLSIVADIGYKISEVVIDGESYDFLGEDEKKNEVIISYTFTADSSEVSVAFETDPEDTRTEATTSGTYEAPEILAAAVDDNASLPDDVDVYEPISSGTTSKYNNTMGISTGIYYASNNKFYKMVYSSQKSDEPQYYSKAEAINGIYSSEGLVYGSDYDLIRLYNYHEEITTGPSTGDVALYCTYLYKKIDPDEIGFDQLGTVTVDNSHTNTAALLVQSDVELSITDLTADIYTASRGPSEAGNFYGLRSAIHIDGGDAITAAKNTVNENTNAVTLNNPQILGTVNSIYSLASGVLNINGGNIFSKSSGGHGPYVSTGGQIYINTDGTALVDSDGTINRDSSSITTTTRPSLDLGSMTRNVDGDVKGVFEYHPLDVTVIVTGDEAGTALATDTGGGVIVANNVVGKSYGLRSAGVYSIGSNESWIYTVNSTLMSALDAGLVSASGGYIYAFNTDIYGVMGIKTRAGGNAEAEETGITVENSRVSAYYDYDEMVAVYDVADPADWDDTMADTTTDSDQLNIFIDKANTPKFYEESLAWWFQDKSLTPGYSGGNKFAVIYVENSSTPIYISNTRLNNKNYQVYGELSEEAIAEGQTPADNLLLSVEGGGSGNIVFKNENSETFWDLTGVSEETCELSGDFYLGAIAEASDNPNLGSGSNSLNVDFENSEWEGTVIRGDNSGAVSLVFDALSHWEITGDAVVSDLTLSSEDNLNAESVVTITVAGKLEIAGEIITEGKTIGNVTFVLDPTAIELVEGSDGMPEEGEFPFDGAPPGEG
jgi:hypothetical protein